MVDLTCAAGFFVLLVVYQVGQRRTLALVLLILGAVWLVARGLVNLLVFFCCFTCCFVLLVAFCFYRAHGCADQDIATLSFRIIFGIS